MHSNIDRRDFIKKSTGAGLGLLVASSLSASGIFQERKAIRKGMGGLTPISVIDNACLLAFCSGKLSQESQNTISTDIHLRDTPGNKGRLAVVLPPGESKLMDLIEIVKGAGDTKHREEKRAIVFGWTAVNAVERNINAPDKMMSQEEQESRRFHQDAILIRSFSPDHEIENIKQKEAEDLINSILTRTIVRIHTIKPDSDDGIGWVNRMSDWRKENKAIANSFSKAIISPDRHTAGQDFFNEKDKMVEYAVRLQNGVCINPKKIMEALRSDLSCTYAQALAEATKNILAIDQYLCGTITKQELKTELGLFG